MPIPGTTKLHRLEENLSAATIQLSDDDRARLSDAAADIDIVGDRYHERMQQTIDR